MVSRRLGLLLTFVLCAALFVMPTVAQDNAEVVADGLRNPRNLFIAEDGTIYVAEAGVAGPETNANDGEFGASSQISMVAPDGRVSLVVRGLISNGAGNSLGASAVHVTADSIWFVIGETRDASIAWSDALVELDRETGRVKTFVDLLGFELANDPDGNPNQQANPTDFEVLEDGSILIAVAGCNCLLSWDAESGLAVAAVWSHADDNPVPTSVEVDGNGDVYVGFLTGFPFPEGGSRIERWSGGELAQTWDGLNPITGLEVTADGRIFATEFGIFAMGAGWSAGRVVEVTDDGIMPILEDLNQPYGLEQGADGRLYVSVNSTGGADGQILAISLDN